MNRRIALQFGAAMLAWPALLLAQAPKNATVGFLISGSRRLTPFPGLFSSAMRDIGWVEGRNLTPEWRYAEGQASRLPELASELVQLAVQVIVTTDNIGAEAARRATRSIPIVVTGAIDPVKSGFAQSLARPGGNVTGVIWGDPAFNAKSVQILKEMVPGMRRLGLLHTADYVGLQFQIDAIEAACGALGVSFHQFPVSRPEDVGAALAAARKAGVNALRVAYGGAVGAEITQILEFTATNKIPTSFTISMPVERGGFMSYSPSLAENAARAAALVDKLLKGAKPEEQPFEYPTRYELVVNLRTTRALGLTIPQSVLLRADRVIE
jgi:putative ABC transport system substrate-binding protein